MKNFTNYKNQRFLVTYPNKAELYSVLIKACLLFDVRKLKYQLADVFEYFMKLGGVSTLVF